MDVSDPLFLMAYYFIPNYHNPLFLFPIHIPMKDSVIDYTVINGITLPKCRN